MQDNDSGPAAMQLTNKNSEDAVPGSRECAFVIVGKTIDTTIHGDVDFNRDVNYVTVPQCNQSYFSP